MELVARPLSPHVVRRRVARAGGGAQERVCDARVVLGVASPPALTTTCSHASPAIAPGRSWASFRLSPTAARRSEFAGSNWGDHFHPRGGPGLDAAVAGAAGSLLRSEPRFTRIGGDETSTPRPVVGRGTVAYERLRPSLWSSATPGPPPHHARGSKLEEYLGSRSRNLRSQLGRKRQALGQDHLVEMRWTGAGDDLGRDMATFVPPPRRALGCPLRDVSLTESARAGVPHGFAAALADRGWLRLCFLEADSEPVAGWAPRVACRPAVRVLPSGLRPSGPTAVSWC